ncbi:MAG: glycosyltransferase family 2 protein [Deltaproteobacteria bacterium]
MKYPTPLISIIVAVFNGAKTLQQCIDSVAQQSYANKELIIIDGGSKDGTADLLKANSERISYWISEPDRGIYNAWNKGLAQAKGDWICFLGADDYFWDLQVLERVSAQLEKIPSSIRVAYAQVVIVSESGGSLYRIGEPWQKVKNNFNQFTCIPHTGTMHRRSLFELHGGFDESFRISGDYELLLRELKTGDAYFAEDVIVVAMRIGGVSWSVANSSQVVLENMRAFKMHGQHLTKRLWLMVKAYIKVILWVVFGERFARKVLDFYRRIRCLPTYWARM